MHVYIAKWIITLLLSWTTYTHISQPASALLLSLCICVCVFLLELLESIHARHSYASSIRSMAHLFLFGFFHSNRETTTTRKEQLNFHISCISYSLICTGHCYRITNDSLLYVVLFMQRAPLTTATIAQLILCTILSNANKIHDFRYRFSGFNEEKKHVRESRIQLCYS